MHWLTKLITHRDTPDDERRAQQTIETRALLDEFSRDLRESIQAVREAGADSRKGYPVEHALRRPRRMQS